MKSHIMIISWILGQIGYVDGNVLKLKGSSPRVQNFTCLFQHGEGNLSSKLLWHARYSHLNYNSLYLLRKTGVFGFPTIPKKMNKCDACILGKDSKQPFQDSKFRACRKLELIHYDLCDPMHVPYSNGNRNCLLAQMSYFHPFHPSLFLTPIPIHHSNNHSLCHFHK